MPTSPIVQLLILFSLSGVVFALWKGNTAERLAAGVVVTNMALGLLFHALLPQIEGILRFANDGLAAVTLLAVTLRYGAPWMGGVMLFYAAQFSLHSYYMVSGRPETDYLHALVNNLNFGGITWCLIIGAAVAWRRRVKTARASAATAVALSPAPHPPGPAPAP